MHPFGHGKESFFWALLAAIGTLVAGARFAVIHGYQTIHDGEDLGSVVPSYVVLALAFAIESVSLTRAMRQLTSVSRSWSTTRTGFLRRTPDTALIAGDPGGLRAPGRAAPRRPRPGTDRAHRVGGLGRDQLHRNRAAARRGGAGAREGERLAADRQGGQQATAGGDPRRVGAAAGGAPGADPQHHVPRPEQRPGRRPGRLRRRLLRRHLESTSDAAARRLSARFPVIRHVYLDPTPGPPAQSR